LEILTKELVREYGIVVVPDDDLEGVMTVQDLKAAYNLVCYSGCLSDTLCLIRLITKYAQTGYVTRRTMQSGCGQLLSWGLLGVL
jgi:hypothetical protein